jgi:hypothetical protein
LQAGLNVWYDKLNGVCDKLIVNGDVAHGGGLSFDLLCSACSTTAPMVIRSTNASRMRSTCTGRRDAALAGVRPASLRRDVKPHDVALAARRCARSNVLRALL